MTGKPRPPPVPVERLPFFTATQGHVAAVGRHHGGRDGARLVRLPIQLAAHLGDPDQVYLTPTRDGTVVISGLPLETEDPPSTK